MKRLIGFDSEGDSMDSDKLRHSLVGGHIADYMRYLSEKDEEKFKSHFSRFIKEGVTADMVRQFKRFAFSMSCCVCGGGWVGV